MNRAVLLGLALALAACPSPKFEIPPESVVEGATPEAWQHELPRDLAQVRLHAHADALFLTAHRGASPEPERVHLAFHPRSGEILWEQTLAAPGARPADDDWRVTPSCLLYVHRQRLTCLDRKTGQPRWAFSDPDLRPLYATFTEGDAVLVNLGNETLVVLEERDGAQRAAFALRDEPLKQVVGTEAGLVAVLVSPPTQAQPQATLWGALLPKEAQPKADPPPPLPRRWERPIASWSYDLHRVGPVLLGALDEGRLTALDALTGQDLWTLPEAELPSKPLYAHQTLWLSTPDPDGDGQTLRLLGFDPKRPPQGAPLWSLNLPTAQALLGLETAPPPSSHTLGATLDTFFVLDEATGALRWSYHFDHAHEPGSWTNASSDGAGVFLYLEQPGKPSLLKRVPILAE
jgi:outer membrane protein assembly factor BamB